MAEPSPAYSVASGALSLGGDIIGAFMSYYGIKEQAKLTRETNAQNRQMFDINSANEMTQFNSTLANTKDQFGRTMALNEQTAGQNYILGSRGMDISEKTANANIAASRAATEQAKADRITSGKMLYLNNLTRFFNTPETRSAFANLWK